MWRGSALLLVAVALTACGGSARPKPVQASGLPGQVVVADGHRVYFDCAGSGTPTVVFLSGWGTDSSSWQPLLNQLSHQTRACVYDRYGVGLTALYGKLPRRARDAYDQARELEQLLQNADIRAPYVLVGHSWGGALARLYTGTHPDVKALVLVDSSSPGQDAAIARSLPPAKPTDSSTLKAMRHPQAGNPLTNPEHLGWDKSLNETGTVRNLGHLPLIVITAGETVLDYEKDAFPAWLKLQNRLAALSSQSVHVLARTSGHFVQTEDPALVETAIRAAVKTVQTGKPLRSCRQIFGANATDRQCLR